MKIRLSAAGWRAASAWTIAALIGAVPVSVLATNTILTILAGGMDIAGFIAAIAIPILLGGPATFITALKHQQLKIANSQLQILASTDELTSMLNRRAFTGLVASYLAGGAPMQTVPEGAFLVIDADYFKSINDNHGHDWGDEALQRIAATIKSNVRTHDIVGRIGGEEFGVLLAGADFPTARYVAERIRTAIGAIDFQPGGAEHRLTVSVGGATFGGSVAYSDLYRVADQRLYEAKEAGRNCVTLTAMLGEDAARAA